jgi:PilZ domain
VNQPASRRQNQRFPVDFEVDVTRGESTLRARVRNASLGGLFIELDDPPKLGDMLKVRFEIGGQTVESMAVVRWHGPHGVGVQFDGQRARDVYALGKYFEALAPAPPST